MPPNNSQILGKLDKGIKLNCLYNNMTAPAFLYEYILLSFPYSYFKHANQQTNIT